MANDNRATSLTIFYIRSGFRSAPRQIAVLYTQVKIGLAFRPPMIEKRPGLAEDGVGSGERQASDVLIHARAFAWLAIIHIHVLSRRVGPDDVEVLARSEVLVADAGGDDDPVARADGFDDARLAAQLHPGRT